MTRNRLPEAGTPWPRLNHQLTASRAGDLDWNHGAFYYHWPEPGGNVHQAAMAAANMFHSDIWLGRFNQPILDSKIADLEDFVLDLHDAMEIAVRDVANAGVACASTRVAFA